MQALYLIAGTDGAKIDATRGRLRARAEREAGVDTLEGFEPGEGRGMPDHEALLAAIPAVSLVESRRYLLAHGGGGRSAGGALAERGPGGGPGNGRGADGQGGNGPRVDLGLGPAPGRGPGGGGEVGEGGPPQAGRILAQDAPLRGQAARSEAS